MSILSKIILKARANFEVLVCGCLLLLLLLRNPFSLRTQIPNFAPAPDAFYYIVPARSLVEGKGPFMVREGRSFSPIVPPLYSFVLAPFFLIRDDPRMFYFANVGLAFLSYVLFAVIARFLFPKHRLVRFVLLFLFATNPILYWFPTLAMAENLMLPIFLGCLWLLLTKVSSWKIVAMGVLAICLYATKYVTFPLTGTFLLLYVLKLQHLNGFTRQFWRSALIVLLSATVVFLGFGLYTRFVLGQNDYFDPVTRVLGALNIKAPAPQTIPAAAVVGSQESSFEWFSFANAPSNFPLYARMVTGRSMPIVWEWIPLMGVATAALGWLGLVVGFLGKKHFEAFSLFLLIISQGFLLLLFYTPDARYMIHTLPILFLGVGLFFDWAYQHFKSLATLLLIALLIYLGLTSALRLKKDIMLNLKYTESPWWYIAVLELNKTIETELPKLKEKQIEARPYVITPLYPYLVDFFSTGKYALLPMHPQQEFRAYKNQAWGDFDYDHLETEYLRLISQGHPLYLASYGIGHEEILIDSFAYLQKAFRLVEISSECHNLCKVYRVLPSGKSLNLKGLK